jgi:type IV pilus assembly protein PilM
MLLVHESMDELSFVLVESGKLLALRSLEASYTSVAEIHKTLLYFTSLYPTLQVETIYFIGGDKKIQEDLQEAAGKPVLLPTHFPFSLSLEETVQYSVAIGAALAQQEVNFRQKEYAYPHPLRRYRKPLALFFSLSLTAAAVMILATQYQFRHQRSRLTEHYHALVKHENIDSSPSPLHSPEDFTRALQACEKTLRAKPDTFPLYPRVPKCREVMQWLTTIALPNGEEEPLLVVDSLHYQMVRRPEFTHKRDKYRVRLDLEITLRDAHAARSIQEALKDPDSLVDTTEDMQWVPVKGKYKVSCFLKDKTKYN